MCAVVVMQSVMNLPRVIMLHGVMYHVAPGPMTMIRPLRIGGEILQKVLETHLLGTREHAISPHAVEGFLLYRCRG